MRRMRRGVLGAVMMGFCGVAACAGGPAGDTAGDTARLAELEARFKPGLHSLMGELGMRHASLWFAGDAGNWELADYVAHEMEEVAGDIRELHPEYDGVAVAALMDGMLEPVLSDVEAAIDARDGAAFVEAYDRLTTSCTACHAATGRSALVMQRPTAPPVTNLRYRRE